MCDFVIGDRVRVTAPTSAFYNREATVQGVIGQLVVIYFDNGTTGTWLADELELEAACEVIEDDGECQ